MKMHTWVTSAALVLGASSAFAQEFHIDLGLGVGYLIAGDSSRRGRAANPTGGLTFAPFARISIAVPRVVWLDAIYTQSPLLVTPFTLDRTGFIDANDLGLDFHPESRAFSVVIAGTAAPSYARFCNIEWCLKEALMVWGGEAHMVGNVAETTGGRGLHVNLTARLLYAQPTAWTWAGLPAADREIIPTMVMITGGGEWIW